MGKVELQPAGRSRISEQRFARRSIRERKLGGMSSEIAREYATQGASQESIPPPLSREPERCASLALVCIEQGLQGCHLFVGKGMAYLPDIHHPASKCPQHASCFICLVILECRCDYIVERGEAPVPK